MKLNKYIIELENIKDYIDTNNKYKVDDFFNELLNRINLPLIYQDELISHYINAFKYYLDNNLTIDEIIKRLDFNNINDFYKYKNKRVISLDTGATLYPLMLRFGKMFVYRVSATLNKEVVPEILQMALDFSLKRFPSFSAIIKSGLFWHFLETSNDVINIEEENDIPCKPISILLRSSRSLRILYYKNRISLEIFHGISDGLGASIFLKTLIREYYILLGKDISNDKETLDINEEVKEEELVNEFKNIKKDDSISLVDEKSIQLEGKISKINPYKIIHFELDKNKLIDISKKNDSTVTGYLLTLFFIAIKNTLKNKSGNFNIQLPVNMRKFNKSKTLRNYTMIASISMKLENIKDKENLMEEINNQLNNKVNKDYLYKEITNINTLIKRLHYIPLTIKYLVFKYIYSLKLNKDIGIVFSNLGEIKTPVELNNLIKYFDFVFTPLKPYKVVFGLTSYNNISRLSLIKSISNNSFENEIYQLLKEDDLIIKIEGSPNYGD